MVNSKISTEMGVDVNRKWQLWNNDLILVNNFDNLEQAIYNRLMTTLNDMAYFYDDYGSRLREYFGQPMIDSVLDSIAEEVITELDKEPRISQSRVQVAKIDSHSIAINITCIIDEDDTFETNFVFDAISNTLDYVGDEITQMRLDIGVSTCPKNKKIKTVKAGEIFELKCTVLNEYGNPVPIGVVDFSYGNVIFMSKEITNRNANIKYAFPKSTPLGTYKITAHYRGVGRFSNCTDTIDVIVSDKYETKTKFEQNLLNTYAGQNIQFPTSVKNVLGGVVNEGTVEYTLIIGDEYKLPTKITASNMYTESLHHAIFSNARVTDKWGTIIDGGAVNFYIENGDGLAIATKTLLENTFIDYTHQEDRSYLYDTKVKDVFDRPVHGGQVNFSYRRHGNKLNTNTILPDETKAYHGFENMFNSDITDEDNLDVTDGEVEYYIRPCSKCKPYLSKINTNTSFLKDKQLFTHSTVTDEDNIPINHGNIVYDFSETPIAFKTSKKLIRNTNYVASIVDGDGNIIDIGNIIKQKTENGQNVTTYVSNDSVEEDEDMVNLEVVNNNSHNKEGE